MAEGSGVSTMTLGSLVSKEAVLVTSPNTGDSSKESVKRMHSGCASPALVAVGRAGSWAWAGTREKIWTRHLTSGSWQPSERN